MKRFAASLLLACLATGCAAPPERLGLEAVPFASLPGWANERHGQALPVFLASCSLLERTSNGKALAGVRWASACAAAKAWRGSARDFFETHFQAWRASAGGKREGLLTGYYEPMLEGALAPGGRYNVPVYGLPPDLSREPYLTRTEIEDGALAGRGLEIAWVKDPVALFFAQIQGSARLRLPDGRMRGLGYAGKNHRAYVPIGRLLAERGLIEREQVTMFTIRDWLKRHPAEAAALMRENPSYVFFRLADAPRPTGTGGTALTAGRSLAVDNRFLPLGAPVYLATHLPGGAPFERLMVAQDTGGAIKGPLRGDIFFGFGGQAERHAGGMKQPGQFFVLLPEGEMP